VGEGSRDEPLAVGASRQRIDEQPKTLHQIEGAKANAISAAHKTPSPTTEEHDYSTRKLVRDFLALCHDPLQNLPGWLDAHRRQGRNGNRLFARQGAGLAHDDGLRQVRPEARPRYDQLNLREPAADDSEPPSIDGELTLLRQSYGAAIDATRRSAPKRDLAAAVRALRRELKAAIFAITTRHRNEQASRRALARHRREARDLNPIK
jgi:hypothetical protein